MPSGWKLSEKEEESDEISEPTERAFFFLRSNLFNLSKEDASSKGKLEKEDYLLKLKKVIYTRESNRVSIRPPARNFLPKENIVIYGRKPESLINLPTKKTKISILKQMRIIYSSFNNGSVSFFQIVKTLCRLHLRGKYGHSFISSPTDLVA